MIMLCNFFYCQNWAYQIVVLNRPSTHGAKALVYYQDGEAAPPALGWDGFEEGPISDPLQIYITVPGWHTIIGEGFANIDMKTIRGFSHSHGQKC